MAADKFSAPQGAPVQIPAPAAAAAPSSQRYKLHSSYIWLGSLRIVVAFAIVLIAGFADAFTSIMEVIREGRGFAVLAALGLLAVVLLVLLGLAFGYQAWSYKHTYYEVGEEEFSYHKGIFTKKRMHVPYQRVQSVNQNASVLQRLVGVCTVKIDTAGGASNEGITIPYVTKAAAESLRREIFARKQAILSGQAAASSSTRAAAPDAVAVGGNVLDDVSEAFEDVRGIFGGAEVETGRISYEYRLTNKELLLSALTNSAASAAIAIGILGTLISVVGGVVGPLLNSVRDSMVSWGAGFAIVFGVLLVIGVMLFVWAVSAVASLLVYGGFRAMRRDRRIEVEHGLLSRSFHGLDIDRVQSVIVKQGFLRRLFGYCELSLGKIDSAPQGETNDKSTSISQGLIVHPFVKLSRVPEILNGLAPEFADVPVQTVPVAPVALRRALVRRCTWGGFGFWLLVACVVMQCIMSVAAPLVVLKFIAAFVAVYVLSVLCIVCEGVSAVLWYRGSGFAYNRDFMRVVNAGFSVRSVTFPRKKIQYGYLATNPFQRMSRVATLHAKSAAGTGTDIKLMDVAQPDADAWFAWLHPHGNRAL